MAVARAALRALRLNRLHVDWKAVADHAEATGEPGWPDGEAWLRVRVDQRLAPEMLTRLQALESEDAGIAAKAAWFRRLQASRLLPDETSELSLVQTEGDTTVFEWLLDRFDLATPSFVRWTLRLAAGPTQVTRNEGEIVPNPTLARRVRVLSSHSAMELALSLDDLPDMDVIEVCRGELGPVREGPGGPWLSASTSRVAAHVRRVVVDDPLQPGMLVPEAGSGVGLSHQRKWAVPESDVGTARQWLDNQGSRNLVYSFRA
jgi:hypothetical protein